MISLGGAQAFTIKHTHGKVSPIVEKNYTEHTISRPGKEDFTYKMPNRVFAATVSVTDSDGNVENWQSVSTEELDAKLFVVGKLGKQFGDAFILAALPFDMARVLGEKSLSPMREDRTRKILYASCFGDEDTPEEDETSEEEARICKQFAETIVEKYKSDRSSISWDLSKSFEVPEVPQNKQATCFYEIAEQDTASSEW